MKNKRLYLCLAGIILLFLLLCFLLFYFPQRDSKKLHAISKELFQEELAKDSLSLHYTLSNPSAYGIEVEEITFPCFSETDYADTQKTINKYQEKLFEINSKQLKPDDAFSYQGLLTYLDTQKEGLAFPYYAEPLSPNSGLQSQLPILLAEYSFYQKSDVENYLILLSKIPAYFESILSYEEKKADLGLFMSSKSAENVILQCDTIITKEALDNNSHFLIQTFDERLKELVKENKITKSDADSFYKENKDLLQNIVYPAYVSLGDNLFLLRDRGKNDMGLSYFPLGKDYYKYLVKSTTGSGKSISELKELLLSNLQETQKDITKTTQSISALLPKCDNQISTILPIDNPHQMITDLKTQMDEEYPAFPVDNIKISCQLKKVDESLEDFVSPAFYMTPPIDNVLNNVIYINEKEPMEAIDIYTTLAHEGYPGHLYQSVYHILSQQENKKAPLESVLYCGGYTEGWAYYVENNSYEFAKEMLPDNSQKALVSEYFELCRLRRNQQLLLFSLLDLAIHYDGLDFEHAQKILYEFGMKDFSVAQNIYHYIVNEPANYLKYCIGYLEILECKKLAMEYWKEDFSPLRFHTFFLECGPTSFPLLQEAIKKNAYNSL